MDDLNMQSFSATVEVSTESIDAHVAALVERDTLAHALDALVSAEPPTGNVKTNLTSSNEIAELSPLTALFSTKIIGSDALARYTPTTDQDRLDQQLAQTEVIGLGLGGHVTARVLDGILERFSPSEGELIEVIEGLDHVSPQVARSLARAILAFQAERYEEATAVAMPRIESLVRALCEEKGILRFRIQRDQRQGPSARGQFPQLGALLVKIKPWLDRSWYRFLWTFLVSPFGPNYRNELLHGYVENVTKTPAALTILGGLRLALVPVNAEPTLEDGDSEAPGASDAPV